jgi:hypothetical protein
MDEKTEKLFYRGDSNIFTLFTLPDYVSFNYKPLPDITAYELSRIMEICFRYIGGNYLTRSEFDNLPEGVRRHLQLGELAGESRGVGR